MCPPASLTRGLNCKGDCHVSKPSDWRYVGVAISIYLVMEILITAVWRSRRGPAKPARKEEVVDLSSAFGVSFGANDSDSSDAEFAPEDGQVDSEGL